MGTSPGRAVVEILAALSYGERLAAARAERTVALAPDPRTRDAQEERAERERANARLIAARLAEVDGASEEEAFAPFFDAFFSRTEPADWLEAQAWHYIGDALVRDFADALEPVLDPVSAEVTRRVLADRDRPESFALDELARLLQDDPEATERVAAYARRVIGEALTHTRRALDRSDVIRDLLGDEEGEKRMLLDLLQRHRARLDRLGIERVD